MEAATMALILSIIGVSISFVNLIWNVSRFRLQGARIKVQLDVAVVTHTGAVMTAKSGTWSTEHLKELQIRLQDGLWAHVAQVTVTNQGRSPITIEPPQLEMVPRRRWHRWRRSQLQQFGFNGLALSDRVVGNDGDHRLESGDHAEWFFALDSLCAWAEHNGSTRMRAACRPVGHRVVRSSPLYELSAAPSWLFRHAPVDDNTHYFRKLLTKTRTGTAAEAYAGFIEISAAVFRERSSDPSLPPGPSVEEAVENAIEGNIIDIGSLAIEARCRNIGYHSRFEEEE